MCMCCFVVAMDGVLEGAVVLCVCKLACSLLFLPWLAASHSPVSFCCCCLLTFTDFLVTGEYHNMTGYTGPHGHYGPVVPNLFFSGDSSTPPVMFYSYIILFNAIYYIKVDIVTIIFSFKTLELKQVVD